MEETVPALLAASARRFPDRPAVRAAGSQLTYSELQRDAKRFAAALVSAGVRPQDRVAIWAPNSTEWIVAVLGLLQAGATLVPVNTRFKGAEAAGILSRAKVRALVTVTDFLGTDYLQLLRSSGASLPDLEVRIVASGPVPPQAVGWDQFVAGAAVDPRSAKEVDRRAEAVTAGTPSDILFTSGTTGVPKGVVMTHSRTLTVATDWVAMTGLGPDDRYLMVNPYFHMFGLKAGILAGLAAGATMLPEPVLDVDRVLQRVEAERVTVLPGPPTLYQTILDHPDVGRHDLSSLRVAVTGSADIPVELIKRVRAELPFHTIISGYGLTEAGTAAGTGPEDDFEAIATTVGRPRPGFEIRLLAGDGPDGDSDAGPGETGEIWLRGAGVMSHYLDDPDATAEALTPDGWLRTGDLGTRDEQGRLRIVGRLKDMFIVGGFNAYPAEIENLMLAHPDVGQVAVIGVPDRRLGEVGVAFVVPRPGADLSPDGVIAWSRQSMANYKVPRAVVMVDELPMTATGKVQKDALRKLLPQ